MIQSKLADMYVWVETMRTFTYRVLAAANDLEIGGGGRGEIHTLTAASVMYAADTMNRVLDEGRADPRRLRLYLGVGDQPALPLDQAARDRRRHHRGAQADHQPGAVAGRFAPLDEDGHASVLAHVGHLALRLCYKLGRSTAPAGTRPVVR